ncbi:MAG: PAS domain S-box protein [Chloroflexota bacterium]|nr:PAS domain S-box protein [Chloroflexota bacterium]
MNSPSVNSNEAPPIQPRKNAWILSPGGIVAVYLLLGALWILLSDLVVATLFPDRDTFAWAQTIKGWFFVALTTLLLYGLIRRTVHAVKFARGAQTESESKFRTLVEQIPAVTYVAIPHGGGTTYMSPQAQPLLGYSPDEWNGIPDMWHRLLHPEDHDRVAAELEQTYRTGDPFLTEYRMLAKDGRTFWFRDEATVALDGGKPVRLQGVMVDITERKAAEEAIRRERDFSSTVLDITASLVIVLDTEGRIIRFNQACERLLGYSAAEVVGRSMWEDLFLPEDMDGVRQQFAKLRSGQLLSEYTNRVVTKSGETRLVSWSNSAMLDAAGKVDYIVVTGTDITERQANEQQLQEQAALQTRLLRELLTAQEAERHRLSMEIHDGPLQSLGVSLMALDRAMRRGERGEVDQSLRELQNLRTTLASTVGEVRSVLADLSLDLLQQQGLVPALSDHAHRFSEITGIEVQLDQDIGERLPKHIELMAYRLAQEALSNVRKHANASKVEIKMKAEAGRLVMSIADNGQGFDANAEQIDSLPGERLGLRSMQERVHNARGDFTIDSGTGEGTTLTFVVPYGDG